jgi:hypothetical protein
MTFFSNAASRDKEGRYYPVFDLCHEHRVANRALAASLDASVRRVDHLTLFSLFQGLENKANTLSQRCNVTQSTQEAMV